MTTLEEFVRDGVVSRVGEDWYYIQTSTMSQSVDVKSSGEVSVTNSDCESYQYLTPTQLRALSAMALWAAESMERKNNA